MIQYVTVGTRNLDKSAAFFDSLLQEFGATRVMENERMVFWMPADGGPGLSVCLPFDTNEASVGNGTMIALSAADTDHVDRIYKKAIELGAQCEGKPGKRGDTSYAGYFRDLDGNKFNAICFI